MLTFKLAFAIARRSPFRAAMTFLTVVIASALLTLICCFASTMIADLSPSDRDYVNELMTFMTLVIVVAVISVILVRAVFAINFNEKVNIMGLLATVGMTNGGKTLIIAAETAFYALFGSLVGTVLGRFISVWHIDFINSALQEYYIGIYGERYGNGVSIIAHTYHAPFWVLLTAFLLSVAVAAFASLKPMLRAGRLSVINSLKADVRINVSLREGIFEKIMCKFFGRIGRLAGQNFDNNASRYRAVSMTLPCAQIVFVSFYALCMWDYWEDGIFNAYNDPMFTSYMAVGYILTAMSLLGALGSAAVNINGRMREFAVLKSMGMSNSDMFRLMCSEGIFIMLHAVSFGLIGSYLSVWAQFQFLWTSRIVTYFHFPWREWLVFVGIDVLFCLFFAIYAILKIRRINIAEAMK